MSAWDRYFHGEHGAARVYLLSKLFLGMLALDAWMLMIGHAGRYGAGGFNVAHVAWLDRVQPIPTPPLYLGVLLLTGLVALWLMLAGIRTLPMLVLTGLYTFSWSMSMLDSYQHHYFVSLILLCMSFFPRVSASEVVLHGERRALCRGFGFPMLGVLTAIVYVYTAIAKMDPIWLDGHTIQSIHSAKQGFGGMAAYFGRWGVEEPRFWSLTATLVIPQELFMGVAYLAAVMRDRVSSLWLRAISAAGFLLAMLLHVGAEHMGLEIGWFSYYMIAMACCFLLPLPLVALLAWPLTRAASAIDHMVTNWEREETGRGFLLALTGGGVVILIGVGRMLDLPGASTATGIAATALVIGSLVALFGRRQGDPRRHVLAATAAALVMWSAIASSTVRWDYYRFIGGDHRRRGEPEAALAAYLKGELYAPEGQSRRKAIKELKRELGK